MPWDLVIAMPAAALPHAVDAGDTAIIPFADARYQSLIAAEPHIRTFLESFRTAFGHHVQPAIVVREREAGRIQPDDLAALRNIIAVAAVMRARTDRSVHRYGGQGPVYADLFELYPVNLGLDAETVMVQTAAEFGVAEELGRFVGQPHPAYIYPHHVTPEFDHVLLSSLITLWRRRPGEGDEGLFRRRVFRSLETVYHALASPFLNLGSQYDHALRLALWVSAFEILTDGGDRESVERLIRGATWSYAELRSERVRSVRRRPHAASITRPIQTCQRLYEVRNESLHGGEISANLVLGRFEEQGDAQEPGPHEPLGADEWNHLGTAVPVLYRAALLGLLAGRRFHEFPTEPGGDDLEAHLDYLQRRDGYRHYEKPLLYRSRLPNSRRARR